MEWWSTGVLRDALPITPQYSITRQLQIMVLEMENKSLFNDLTYSLLFLKTANRFFNFVKDFA